MKLYKLIFVANAFLLLISICLTNKEITLGEILINLTGKNIQLDLPDWVSYCIYFSIPILTTWYGTTKFYKLDPTEIKEENITEIESASSTFLPTFFAYVFVGLSSIFNFYLYSSYYSMLLCRNIFI